MDERWRSREWSTVGRAPVSVGRTTPSDVPRAGVVEAAAEDEAEGCKLFELDIGSSASSGEGMLIERRAILGRLTVMSFSKHVI